MTFFKILFYTLSLLLIMTFLTSEAQTNGDRIPYAAGRFYTDNPDELNVELEHLFSLSKKEVNSPVLAIISPHAGFVYSGEVAASGFTQLENDREFENIFILGSSHTSYIEGASVYASGNYVTPLGSVKVDTSLAKQLIEENEYISFKPSVHAREHIIENQLPFIQHYLKKPFTIVPIVIGTDDERILRSLANSLSPFLTKDNLFVISADFSHYPNYEDAVKADSVTTYSITYNEPELFERALKENEKKKYGGLVTSTCGSTAIKTLLYMTQGNDAFEYYPVKYMNSGDASIGNKDRVVGYSSIVLIEHEYRPDQFILTEANRSELLRVARFTLEEYLNKNEVPILDPSQFSGPLVSETGAFVTLNRNGKLRGCIGSFRAEEPLYQTVQDMTIAAATEDSRFTPVRPEELDMIDIEISVLTPLRRIASIDEIELGRDGIYIVKGYNSGTFLPQVGRDTGWTLEEYLGHCARDKAGIGWDGWRDAEIYTYQAIVFGETEAD